MLRATPPGARNRIGKTSIGLIPGQGYALFKTVLIVISAILAEDGHVERSNKKT